MLLNINDYKNILLDINDKYADVGMILTKIHQNTQKEKHKDQINLIDNIDFWYNKFYKLHRSETYKNIKQEEVELLENKILNAIEKSNNDNSYQYIILNISGVEHTLPLCIHKNKMILIDSMFEAEDNNKLYKYSIKPYISNKFLKEHDILFTQTSLKNQTDCKSCPIFTIRNLTKLDKFFRENPNYFDEIFETTTKQEKDGMKIFPLFPLLQDIQSISRIEELSGIEIKYNTEPQKDSFVIENSKKDKIIINIKDKEKVKVFFGSTKEEQEIKLKKLVKYMEFNKSRQKLQNFRINVKREKYYENIENANKEFLEYIMKEANEKVINSLC